MTIYIPTDSKFYFHIEGDRLHKTHYKMMVNMSLAKYMWTQKSAEDLEKELLNKIAVKMTDCWKILSGEMDESEI